MNASRFFDKDEEEMMQTLNGAKWFSGTIVGGGWEHDAFRNPCARVEILIDGRHMTLVDDAANGWTLERFDDAPNPQEAFKQTFQAEFEDAAEFDYAVLQDFVRTLERVGSERIAEAYGGKTITMEIDSTMIYQQDG